MPTTQTATLTLWPKGIFGLVPAYIHGAPLHHYLRRRQMQFPFPATPAPQPTTPKLSRSRLMAELQQPRRYPVGWYKLAARNPKWRAAYLREWKAQRRAAGLPCEVNDPIWSDAR